MAEPFIAEIKMFAGDFAPRGWSLCEGQLLAISSHSALFSLLGTIYGGDGRTTFALPDLRGRVPVQKGSGPGLTPVRIGQKGGAEKTTITTQNLPSHSHQVDNQLRVGAQTGTANHDDPDGAVLGASNIFHETAADVSMAASSIKGTLTVGNTGGGQPVNNLPPFLGLNFIIALTGVFPSRS